MHTQAGSRAFVRNSDVPVPSGRSLQSIPPCFLPFQTRSRYAVRENPDPTATHSTPPPLRLPEACTPPCRGAHFYSHLSLSPQWRSAEPRCPSTRRALGGRVTLTIKGQRPVHAGSIACLHEPFPFVMTPQAGDTEYRSQLKSRACWSTVP